MNKIKVIAINGSPRINGNTSILLRYVLSELEENGIATELVSLASKSIVGCNACNFCVKNQDKKCVSNDFFNECFDKIVSSQAVILGSPTYVAGITPEMKALIDKATYVSRANGHLLKNKLGAAVVSVRRAGGIQAFDMINHMFLVTQMFVVGSSYWNIGYGKDIGDVEKDQDGITTMKDLGQNMAWLLKKMWL